MDSNLLIHFKIDKGEFFCYGEVSVWEQSQIDDVGCPVLEFSNVTAKRLDESGVAVDYEPTETNWNGVRFTAEDMVTSVLLNRMTSNTGNHQIKYLCPKLETVLSFYTKQRVRDVKPDMSIIDNWPLRLLKDGDTVFSLMMVTDTAVYYSHDDAFLMFLPEGLGWRKLILLADNYFAETGFSDSVASVKAGTERLYYLAPGINLDDYE